MSDSFFSFSDPLNSGIDFYTKDEGSFIQISLSGSADAIATLTFSPGFISSNISANSDAIITVTKIAFAAVSIVADGATLTLGTRIKLADANLTASADLTANAAKIAFASANIITSSQLIVSAQETLVAQVNITSTSLVTVSAIKEARATIAINATSNMTAVARAIKFTAVSIFITSNLSVMGKISLATIRINILNNTSIIAQAIKFSNTGIDFSLIRSLLMLDGVPLTNQNRRLDVSATPIYIENLNWQGDASRYYKNIASNSASKRTFNLQWSFIPNYENKTVDLRASRNFLNKKSKDGDVHTLTILNQDESGTSPYTEETVDVLIVNYSENLVRRDLVDNVYYFDCSMSLQEV